MSTIYIVSFYHPDETGISTSVYTKLSEAINGIIELMSSTTDDYTDWEKLRTIDNCDEINEIITDELDALEPHKKSKKYGGVRIYLSTHFKN